jgi:hypothetical protein
VASTHGTARDHGEERVGREVAANRRHALADALARHNDVEFERGGLQFEVEDDKTQLDRAALVVGAPQPSSSIS